MLYRLRNWLVLPIFSGIAYSVLLICVMPAVQAYDAKAESVLHGLNPETRLVKICELEGLDRIEKDKNSLRPEHVMMDYLSQPERPNVNTVAGNQGLLRSGGVWYYFAYNCATNNEHTRVTNFTYKLGEKIKRSQWDELGLFP